MDVRTTDKAVILARGLGTRMRKQTDAALDESNINRFTHILKEFTSDTQFLVITHSKVTMGVANVLYGITMQEPGVSKRVAVKFEDIERKVA